MFTVPKVNVSLSIWHNRESKLVSRQIWQVLFNYYRLNGGCLDYMDCMLCDLYYLEKWVSKERHQEGNKILYWAFSKGIHFPTEFTFYHNIFQTTLSIQFSEDEHSIIIKELEVRE